MPRSTSRSSSIRFAHRDHRRARGGEAHPRGAAVQQRAAREGLEVPDALRHRRATDPEPRPRPREAALRRAGDEGLELIELRRPDGRAHRRHMTNPPSRVMQPQAAEIATMSVCVASSNRPPNCSGCGCRRSGPPGPSVVRVLGARTQSPPPPPPDARLSPCAWRTGRRAHARDAARQPLNPPEWIERMQGRYGGTNLGRQELDGELIDDTPGALCAPRVLRAPPRVSGLHTHRRRGRPRRHLWRARR